MAAVETLAELAPEPIGPIIVKGFFTSTDHPNQYLILFEGQDDDGHFIWPSPVGGHFDPDQGDVVPEDALVREAWEETGGMVSLESLREIYRVTEQISGKTSIYYMGHIALGPDGVQTEAGVLHQWLTMEEMTELNVHPDHAMTAQRLMGKMAVIHSTSEE